MNIFNRHYVTITNLKLVNSFNGNYFYNETSQDYNSITGNLYISDGLNYSNSTIDNFHKKMFVGTAFLVLDDNDSNKDSLVTLHINYEDIINEHKQKDFLLRFYIKVDLFNKLIKLPLNDYEINFSFDLNEYKEADYGFHTIGKFDSFEVTNNKKNDQFFESLRQKHIEYFLIDELCCGNYEGVIPIICKELSESFSDKRIFDNKKELIYRMFNLISDLRWINFNNFDLTKLSENSKKILGNIDLKKLLVLSPSELLTQTHDFNNNLKYEIYKIYNSLWNSEYTDDVFLYGTNLTNDLYLVNDYLFTKELNSATLNSLIIDVLITHDIVDNIIKSRLVVSKDLISALKNPFSDYKNLDFNKSTFTKVFISLFSNWFSFFITGLIWWYISAIFVNHSSLEHYILFTALFLSYSIVNAIKNKEKNIDVEFSNTDFLILKDLYHLHTRRYLKNPKLIKKLMFNLELRGVKFNNFIYETLKRI
ncbi:MAG: hypothetical protein KGI88_05135 [Betaproteobacteria bacterium]|nr:hypothetical protein [Betaproteobacteria bacterium]